MNRSLKKLLPIIISDIDGVLIQDKKAISRVPEAFKQLRKPMNKLQPKLYSDDTINRLPLILLTNNQFSNLIERDRIDRMNKDLLLNHENQLNSTQLVMNYTAMKPYLQSYSNSLILVAGIEDCHIFLKDASIQNYITVDEYAALYPFLVPISKRSHDDIEPTKQKLLQRLKCIKDINLNEPLKIDAIFILGEVVKWEESVQIICDLLTTNDGTIAQTFPSNPPETTIPIYVSSNTIIYREKGELPKVGAGMLQLAIDQCYQLIHHKSVPKSTFKTFGKPQRSAFETALQKALALIDEEKYQAGQIYMIGDNYNQDILGAKQMGWKTILVKQGQKKQDEKQNSDYIVQDFEQAVKLIFKKHQFEYNSDI